MCGESSHHRLLANAIHERRGVRPIRREAFPPIHPNHFQAYLRAVHMDHDVVERVAAKFARWSHEMLERHLLLRAGGEVRAQVRFTRGGVQRRAGAGPRVPVRGP